MQAYRAPPQPSIFFKKELKGKIDKLVSDIEGDKVLTLEPHLAVFEAYKSIDNTEMKHKFTYKDSNEAFDSAVSASKNIIINNGYKEVKGEFIK